MSDANELTRRIWLLHLGGGAVLLNAASEPALPPGLYRPSVDHLAHVLKPMPAPTPGAPPFLTAPEYSQLASLVGHMLDEDPGKPPVPEITNWIDLLLHDSAAVIEAARGLAPAHRVLAAGFYGEEAVQELETLDPRPICRAGLARLAADASVTLDALESAGDPFVRWLKRRVIEGFYTSEAGLKELDYKGNSFYSEPPGCG